MKTKQIILNTGALLLIGFACTAQTERQHSKREQIEAHKIAFITKQLGLTPEEAQVFWPVYNQCQKQREESRKKNREQFSAPGGSTPGEKGKRKNLDEMTDKEVEAMVDNEIAFRQKELNLQKECHAKYKQVLPVKKVARLYRAEKEFKRVLLKKMQEHREPPQRPKPPKRW